MNVGSVDESGDPLVQVVVRSSESQKAPREIEAVLDTGFNGFLALPEDRIGDLELEKIGREEFVTASGATYFPNKYEAVVVLGNFRQTVEIVEAAEPLIGAALLDGYEVCISYYEDGPVEIEALT